MIKQWLLNAMTIILWWSLKPLLGAPPWNWGFPTVCLLDPNIHDDDDHHHHQQRGLPTQKKTWTQQRTPTDSNHINWRISHIIMIEIRPEHSRVKVSVCAPLKISSLLLFVLIYSTNSHHHRHPYRIPWRASTAQQPLHHHPIISSSSALVGRAQNIQPPSFR